MLFAGSLAGVHLGGLVAGLEVFRELRKREAELDVADAFRLLPE
jgi:hypothetical protein